MCVGSRLDALVVEARDAMPGELLTLEYRSSVGLTMKSASGSVFILGRSAGSVPFTLGKGTSIMKSELSREYSNLTPEKSGSGVGSSIWRRGVAGPGSAEDDIVRFLPV